MKPRILFVVMSAVQTPAVVDQLARALAPHQVLVHHDFCQTQDFVLTAPNVRFVPDPKRTGWAVFGFVEAIFHSMQYALDHIEFDYLQLLSPSCLPIKPIEEFEAHVSGPQEAHFAGLDLLADRDVLMSVGYRAFTPVRSLRHRIVGWLTRRYFRGVEGRRDLEGIWLRSGFATNGRGRMTLTARIAQATIRALSHPRVGRHLFCADLRPTFGSTWFGARRHVIATLVEGFSRPGVREYFSRLHAAEEFLIPTLLRSSGARAGPLNHYVHTFAGARAGTISAADFDALRQSPAFFARKFPDDSNAPIRLRVLEELTQPADRRSTAITATQDAGARRGCPRGQRAFTAGPPDQSIRTGT